MGLVPKGMGMQELELCGFTKCKSVAQHLIPPDEPLFKIGPLGTLQFLLVSNQKQDYMV